MQPGKTSTTKECVPRPVALVTGASSGIGRATAERLAASGRIVYGTSRLADAGPLPLHDAHGIRMLRMAVESDDSVRQAVERVLAEAGRIDELVLNAGVGYAGSIEDTLPEEAFRQMDINFFGVHRVIRAVLPGMRVRGTGRIVAVSSVMGFVPLPYQAMYGASKFALEALIESLRHEVAPFGVTACLVQPGDTRTDFTSNRVLASSSAAGPYADAVERSVGRMARDEQNGTDPDKIARTILRMLQKRNPPVRVAVGCMYRLTAVMRRALPARLFELIIGRLYG